MIEKNALNEMEKKAKKIEKIQRIANTILANGCYHTKEMENQIGRAEKTGHITTREREIIVRAWNLRSKKAHELIDDLEEFIINEEKVQATAKPTTN